MQKAKQLLGGGGGVGVLGKDCKAALVPLVFKIWWDYRILNADF